MAPKFLIVFSFLFILTSCSVDTDDTPKEVTITQWNLINVNGGIAGVDNGFELGEIIWVFDEFNGILNVENNNTDAGIEDGLDSGQYNFYFTEDESTIYITIEGIERGSITISEDKKNFTLNQNDMSTGTGADGFVYLFEKTTLTVEI